MLRYSKQCKENQLVGLISKEGCDWCFEKGDEKNSQFSKFEISESKFKMQREHRRMARKHSRTGLIFECRHHLSVKLEPCAQFRLSKMKRTIEDNVRREHYRTIWKHKLKNVGTTAGRKQGRY